jgi:enterochelin esterase family protein
MQAFKNPDGDIRAHVVMDNLIYRREIPVRSYNISKDPERHGIGESSSGAIAGFTVPWERPNHFRQVLSNVGSYDAKRDWFTRTFECSRLSRRRATT